MPIQYYDSVWFNNRPPQARAKIAPKQIVVFAPGSTDFFSRRGENALSVEELTAKYGKTVFDAYDLDFGKADADPKASSKANETSDADDEGDGDSIGSEDSDEDTELSDAASMTSFISDHDASDDEQDDGMYGEDDGRGEDEQHEDAGSGEDDAGEDGTTQFPEAYDIDMEKQEMMASIFDDSDV
jgi:hypothetical protein